MDSREDEGIIENCRAEQNERRGKEKKVRIRIIKHTMW